MIKKSSKQILNGKDNFFKTVVRDVVKEEFDNFAPKFKKELKNELIQELEPRVREIVREEIERPLEKFRDDIFSKIDPLIKLFIERAPKFPNVVYG